MSVPISPFGVPSPTSIAIGAVKEIKIFDNVGVHPTVTQGAGIQVQGTISWDTSQTTVTSIIGHFVVDSPGLTIGTVGWGIDKVSVWVGSNVSDHAEMDSDVTNRIRNGQKHLYDASAQALAVLGTLSFSLSLKIFYTGADTFKATFEQPETFIPTGPLGSFEFLQLLSFMLLMMVMMVMMSFVMPPREGGKAPIIQIIERGGAAAVAKGKELIKRKVKRFI